MENTVYIGDVIDNIHRIPDDFLQAIVTSPPYFNLRDYKLEPTKWPKIKYMLFGNLITVKSNTCCLGLEETPNDYVGHLVHIFRLAAPKLKNNGTLWLNIGDSYASKQKKRTDEQSVRKSNLKGSKDSQIACKDQQSKISGTLKQKDLIGIPWMLAFALREDGWYLRCDIIWSKKNCMPESVNDRPTKSHEYLFLFSKSGKYFYDIDAIKEPAIYDVDGTGTTHRKARQKDSNKLQATDQTNGIRAASLNPAALQNGKHQDKQRGHSRRHAGFNERWDNMSKAEQCTGMRNKRSVWTISPAQFPEAHFATFPEKLITDCIKAGSAPGDIVCDLFDGAGTTTLVAHKLGRIGIGFEKSQKYAVISEKRKKNHLGVFNNFTYITAS